MRGYALGDDQGDRIKPLFLGSADYGGGTAKDNRLFIEAVLYLYRAGTPDNRKGTNLLTSAI
jgi:hypothetical protein